MRILFATAFAVLLIAILIVGRAPAQPSKIIALEGPILEITPDDITIKDAVQGPYWFRLPRPFRRVFAGDGKTPYRLEALHPGQRVRVFFDTLATNYVRSADRIIVLTPKCAGCGPS